MTEPQAAVAPARGQALRSERAFRARAIRRRVISGAVALFVAAWLMITLVLVSGHDPALSANASSASSVTTVAANPTATTSSSGSTGSGGSQSSGSSSLGSGSGSNGGGVSSVTTSQS